jgi:hypothetical protein
MKLIKDGKLFNLETSTLIATSQWYMNYGYKRRKLYKSVNGCFFVTIESSSTDDMRKVQPNMFFSLKDSFYFDVEPNATEIMDVLTLEKARHMYEYISLSKKYGSNTHGGFGFNLHIKDYEELFKLEEG